MGKVGTLQLAALRAVAGGTANKRQIRLAGSTTAGNKTLGDFKNAGMHVLNSRLTDVATCACPMLTKARRRGFSHLDPLIQVTRCR